MTSSWGSVGGHSGSTDAADIPPPRRHPSPRPRTVPAYRPVPGDVDLNAIRPWVQLCGSCDAGLPVSCTHPRGDYRKPMLALIYEVERLREENARLRTGARP